MNIIKCDGFNVRIDYKNNPSHCIFYSYERISVNPEELKVIKLPYFRNNFDKYYSFELEKTLCQKGLTVLWSNINEESAATCIEFLVKNNNVNEVFETGSLSALIGSGKRIDILSGSVIGKIFE